MGFPTKYEDLTVSQWMKVQPIINDDDLNEIDMNIQLISALTGMNLEDTFGMDVIEYGKRVRDISFLKVKLKETELKEFIKIGGIDFKATTSLIEMKANQMIDYDSILRSHGNNIYKCADKLLAIVYKEKGKEYNPDKHEEHTKIFADAKLTDVIGVVFFYSVYSYNAGRIIQVCTDKANQLIMERMMEIKSPLIHS